MSLVGMPIRTAVGRGARNRLGSTPYPAIYRNTPVGPEAHAPGVHPRKTEAVCVELPSPKSRVLRGSLGMLVVDRVGVEPTT